MMQILGYILYLYLRLVYATTRWHMQGQETVAENSKARVPQIIALWHGRSAMLPFFKPPHNPTYVIVSRHSDGDWLSRIVTRLGLGLVRGSSRRAGSKKERGGRHALVEAVKKLREGNNIAMTPDGPRGPRMRVSGAVVEMAKMGGAVIVPMGYSLRFGRMLNNWDRYFVPLPFGPGWFIAGEPIAVPEKADAETIAALKLKLEDALNRLVAEVDTKAGHVPPEPA